MSKDPDFDALARKIGDQTRIATDKSHYAFKQRIWRLLDGLQVKDPAKRIDYFAKIQKACSRHAGDSLSVRAVRKEAS